MADEIRWTLRLDDLVTKLMPGLTAPVAGVMVEAAAVCFDSCQYPTGVDMEVQAQLDAAWVRTCQVYWPPVDERMHRSNNDHRRAAEDGAYGLALLLIRDTIGLVAIEKSVQGTGFDYWLGDDGDPPFQRKARLEVSGTIERTDSSVRSLVKQKLRQTTPTDGLLPAYVVIVRYRHPLAVMVKKP